MRLVRMLEAVLTGCAVDVQYCEACLLWRLEKQCFPEDLNSVVQSARIDLLGNACSTPGVPRSYPRWIAANE